MSGTPRVSVVLANWNGAHHLRVCLPSLLDQTFRPLEIVVVDNASTDNSEEIARAFPLRWLPVGENLGLAPALNRGAAVAAGEMLLFVNNDMRFHPGFVSALVEALDKNQNAFATDGMQFNWDGTFREHLAARLTTRRRRQNAVELVPGLYFHQQEMSGETRVFMASAACMLVRRTLFKKLGGFDSRLPLGYEDVEICWRAWAYGWPTVYVPAAICWHHVGSSSHSTAGALFNFRGIIRGRLLLSTKMLPFRYAFRTWLVTAAGLVKDLGRLRWLFVRDRIATLADMGQLIPQLLRERNTLFDDAGVSPEQLLNSLLELTSNDIHA